MNAIANGVLSLPPDAPSGHLEEPAMRLALLILFISLFSPAMGQTGIITTFAGNGVNNNTGDGGSALSAGINNPIWGVFDRWGNYYIVSSVGNKIRKINAAGIITTVAGTGVAGYNGDGGLADTSQLNGAASAALDSSGNLYIADGSNRVRRVDRLTGIITTVAGNGMLGFSGDGGPATAASLRPNDICFDKKGNMYISDIGNLRIRRVDMQGIITTVAGTGNSIYNGDNIPALTANLTAPRTVTVDDTGNIYIADLNASRVRKIDTNGIITTIVGTGLNSYNGENIQALSANVSPQRMTFDHSGNLYITDFINKRVRVKTVAGLIHTVVGNGIAAYAGDGGPADSASLNGPSGVAFDSCGNLYITEVNQGRIRKVTFDSTCGNNIDTTDTTAIIHNIATQSKIEIYPNPAKEQLTVTGGGNVKDVMIMNAVGQKVMEQNGNSNKTVMNVQGLQNGVYFIKVSNRNGHVVTRMFVKE